MSSSIQFLTTIPTRTVDPVIDLQTPNADHGAVGLPAGPLIDDFSPIREDFFDREPCS